MSQRYNSLGMYFKNEYHKKLIKLSIDGGFTCPNRDGRLSQEGCLFCNAYGSGEFSGVIENGVRIPNQSIKKQIESQIKLTSDKWKADGYLAYFQNFTNTYAPLEKLRRLYDEALDVPGIEGLVIATRPDCIDLNIVKLFKTYNAQNMFWVELGLQTIHDRTLAWLRTKYSLEQFLDTYDLLKEHKIPVVIHLIVGLKGETKDQFLESVQLINHIKPFGIKLHMLNILEGTDLGREFLLEPFNLLDRETYIEWVCDALEILDSSIVIHRLTGDGIHESLIGPLWIKDKRKVLNGIQQELTRRNTYQGFKIEQDHKPK